MLNKILTIQINNNRFFMSINVKIQHRTHTKTYKNPHGLSFSFKECLEYCQLSFTKCKDNVIHAISPKKSYKNYRVLTLFPMILSQIQIFVFLCIYNNQPHSASSIFSVRLLILLNYYLSCEEFVVKSVSQQRAPTMEGLYHAFI